MGSEMCIRDRTWLFVVVLQTLVSMEEAGSAVNGKPPVNFLTQLQAWCSSKGPPPFSPSRPDMSSPVLLTSCASHRLRVAPPALPIACASHRIAFAPHYLHIACALHRLCFASRALRTLTQACASFVSVCRTGVPEMLWVC